MPVCDICGSTALQELRCKVICRNCGTILQSCADLGNADTGASECRSGSLTEGPFTVHG